MIHSKFELNESGHVTSGSSWGQGFTIVWQKEPLDDAATIEDVLGAVRLRLSAFQDTPSACSENAIAIDNIQRALSALYSRTERRTKQGIEGTFAESPDDQLTEGG